MRSARVESSVIRIIFGLPAARSEAGREIEIRRPKRIDRARSHMKMAGTAEAHRPWHRRHGPPATDAFHARRKDAELCDASAERLVQTPDLQYSTAKPGGMVKHDYRHERGRTRPLRLYPS